MTVEELAEMISLGLNQNRAAIEQATVVRNVTGPGTYGVGVCTVDGGAYFVEVEDA